MTRCKLRFALQAMVVAVFACASAVMGSSYNATVYPLMFNGIAVEDSVAQIEDWTLLIKYKLFATGLSDGTGVDFKGQSIFISDTVGYTGSATGNLIFRNDKHVLGGPMLFGGTFLNNTGLDTLMTGPVRFLKYFQVKSQQDPEHLYTNTFSGKYCLMGGYGDSSLIQSKYENHAIYAIKNGNGTLLSEAECATDKDVPFVETTLDVPMLDPAVADTVTYGAALNTTSRTNIGFIHVPPSVTSTSYNHYVESISFSNNGRILVVMPPGGRNTKVFVKGSITGLGGTADNDITVIEATSLSQWDGSKWSFDLADTSITEEMMLADPSLTKSCRKISNADYGGNLLVYTPNDLEMGAGAKNLQGTYISGGNITFAQNTHFAGQLLAKAIYIDAFFDAKDFRYVPFDASILLTLKHELREDHEETGDTLELELDKAPPTDVPLDYCFEFVSEDKANMFQAIRTDIADENIPVCGVSSIHTKFNRGETKLRNLIVLHAVYDALSEETETFKLKVCGLDAAMYPDGDRDAAGCFLYPVDIINVPKNPFSQDTVITGFMDNPLKISTFPALNPDSTKLEDYTVNIISTVSVGTLTLNGVAVKAGDKIASKDLAGLEFVGRPGEYSKNNAAYDSLRFSITSNTTGAVSEDSYSMKINLVSVMYTVKENSSANTLVNTITADFKNPTFSIIDPTSTFAVDASSGKITVVADNSINYEVKDGYLVSFILFNGTTPVDTVAAQITVIDVNDSPSIRDTVFHVSENKPVGTIVGTIPVYDEDKNSKFLQNRFSIIDGPAEKFSVDSVSGVIKTKVLLDYEENQFDTLVVLLKDHEGYTDTATVIIAIDDVMETSEIKITEANDPIGDTTWTYPRDTIFVNHSTIILSWNADGKPQPDTTVTDLHEGYNPVTLTYFDKTKNKGVQKTIYIFVCTKTPEVKVAAKETELIPPNIYTIVEPVAEGDTSNYVNTKTTELSVSMKEPILDATYTDSTCNYNTKEFKSSVTLDTLHVSADVLSAIESVAKQKIQMNEVPDSKAVYTPFNDSLIVVSYTDKVGSTPVTISYETDSKDNIVGNRMKVSYMTTIGGKAAEVSYTADAFTGEPIEGSDGSMYTVSYDYTDKNKNMMKISYALDSKGSVIRDSEGNVGYEVGFYYISSIGNASYQSVRIVVDVIAPKVKIVSPHTDDVLYSNSADVEWTVDVNDGRGAVTQDTLKVQGLNRGSNVIVRVYMDKAGNMDKDTVYVMMKDAKDVDISLVTPVTLVTRDKTEEYYAAHEPVDGQSFAITVYNTKTGKEVETMIGGDFDTRAGSGDEPYPGLEGHLGPTLAVDIKVPSVSVIGGLATLDDIVDKNGLVKVDGVDAAGGKKITVDEYAAQYCSAEFQSALGADISKSNLFHTVMQVKIWVYTTLGNFVDYFSFDQELDNPDYTNDAGLLTMYFEQKPDKDGYVRTASGRLYGTGSYLYKTEVTMKSTLLCDLPPLSGTNPSDKRGAVRKSSDDLLKPFGYKRPNYK